MNQTMRTTLVAIVLFALSMLPASLLARPLPSDSRIATGKLKNGVTWMYRKHDNPPGKMAFMMHVRTGSLNETDAQRGLAHFIEHMCFNGTDNFPPGKLIPYFESIGMEFGADLNAFTSFDQTVYMLFTPDTEKAQVDKALMVLSDYAFRALMLDEEVNKERGVVLEESRRGKNAFQRIRDKLWPELFQGSRFASRLPIGDDGIIQTAPTKEFVDYYRHWYRPENVTVVLVGDADSDPFVPLIEKWFGEYQSKEDSRPPKGPEFKPFTQQRAMVVTDSEMALCEVELYDIRPGRPPTTTVEQAHVQLVERIGGWMIDRRYDDRVKKGEASYRSAGLGVSDFFHDAVLVGGSATGEPEDWAKMLEELIIEASRAREHGFTQREFDLAKKEILADAEHAVKTESTRNARAVASEIIASVNDKEPVLSAQQELDLCNEQLPSIQLSEVNAAFKGNLSSNSFAYVVTMVEKEDVAVPSRDDVLATAKSAWARKVEPLKEESAPTQILAALPTPGKTAERVRDEDLGITSAWLENGVRVHHRFMDYKKDSIWVSIVLAGGDIEEKAENAGISEVSTLAINEGATSRLTSSNLRDLLTGKNINVRASADGDMFSIDVSGSPEDLEIGLQKVYAVLTDGKIEDAAFKNWKLSSLQQIEMMKTMPMFKAREAMEDLLSGGDPRRLLMTAQNVENQSVEKAQAWFDRLRREAPIEAAVVGDIAYDKAMPLIERYVGSLPKRNRSADHLRSLRRLPRPTGPLAREVKVETMTPQAMAMAGFMGCEGRNVSDTRAMQVAANILSSRIVKRIREDLSLVYSIRAGSSPSWIYEDSGRFTAGATCAPENVAKVTDEVHTMFQEFAEKGPSEEELQNAKKQIAENLDTGMLEPTYWFGILRDHDLHGRNFKEQKVEKDAIQGYTAEQVRQVFTKYYTPERRFRVSSVPVKPEASGGEVKKEPVKVPAS